MLIKQAMKVMFHKTSKDYLMPIKQVQTYYEALEASYIKRRNPFRMLLLDFQVSSLNNDFIEKHKKWSMVNLDNRINVL
jgi:hypothetical protein